MSLFTHYAGGGKALGGTQKKALKSAKKREKAGKSGKKREKSADKALNFENCPANPNFSTISGGSFWSFGAKNTNLAIIGLGLPSLFRGKI